jgi:multidrug efflux pump subunit AcrA (membrane-fusion protein)
MVADTYHLEMWAAVPAVYYSLITAGKTEFTVYYKGEKVGTYPIAMKAPTIDEKLRTFDIKGYLNNEDGNLVPGTLTQVEIELQSKNGLAVPLASVLHRRDNDVVYVLGSDGKTVREVPVVKGPDTEGMIEVSSPDIKEGMKVLVEGQSQVSDGDVVVEMSK